MSHKPEICPDCHIGTLKLETYSDQFEYRDQQLVVDGLQCWTCDHCGAEIIRPDQIRHGDRLFADARRRADGLLTGDEIVQIRKALGLTQRQASELFGGGANAFSKYERGEVTQSASMDRLMKLVARFPALLGSLARDAGVELGAPGGSSAYSHVANVSMKDPEFRSRPLRNKEVKLPNRGWRKVA